MEFVINRDFSKLSTEVTFSNTSSILLTMVYGDEMFQYTELHSNSISRIKIKLANFGFGSLQEIFVELRIMFLKMTQLT